ncbi:hypothetical protein [Aeoliella sp.]|uniref:hypothetical protein n=1 Tax=Aeoliella sp. TaxID=2795800 RepID=UPI003CCC0DBD
MTPAGILRIAFTLALVATCVSCGSNLPATSAVSGVVEYDGKPLTGFDHGAVIFTPTGGRLAKGTIDPNDGSFRLGTFDSADGAIVGPAAVTVSATVDAGGSVEDKYQGIRRVIPEAFSDHHLSGLECEVSAGQRNFFRIKISSDGTGTIETE